MPYLLFTAYQIMQTLISLPLQMAEHLLWAQPVSVANYVKACQLLIEHAVTWLATESSWALSKRSTICSGKLCGGFIIFEQCCPCGGMAKGHESPEQFDKSSHGLTARVKQCDGIAAGKFSVYLNNAGCILLCVE